MHESSFPKPPPLADKVTRFLSDFAAPGWLVDGVQHRLVLFLNHILMQEPAARERLQHRQGQVVKLQWARANMQLRATSAGLWERAPTAEPDLLLTVAPTGVGDFAQRALRGDKPEVRIEGDVQFAADMNWLVENLRWDAEEDLARAVGDAPAHTLARFGRGAADALRQFVTRAPRRDRG